MVALASTRLRPGGVLVLETVNPLCFTSLSSFWLDPTHVRPLHPALLLWLAEREGLGGLEIVEATRADPALTIPALDGIRHGNLEQFNEGIERVNETLFGAQDYALVARRPE
jgi:O-antigen chain-terminating methyltransferase